MDNYTLTSKGRPRLGDGQETRIYDVMEELGHGPVTSDQIVKQCEYRRYGSLLQTEPSIRNSVEWHLRNWLKRGIAQRVKTHLLARNNLGITCHPTGASSYDAPNPGNFTTVEWSPLLPGVSMSRFVVERSLQAAAGRSLRTEKQCERDQLLKAE